MNNYNIIDTDEIMSKYLSHVPPLSERPFSINEDIISEGWVSEKNSKNIDNIIDGTPNATSEPEGKPRDKCDLPCYPPLNPDDGYHGLNAMVVSDIE